MTDGSEKNCAIPPAVNNASMFETGEIKLPKLRILFMLTTKMRFTLALTGRNHSKLEGNRGVINEM